MENIQVGDHVRHSDRDETGTVNRIIVDETGVRWYRVSWPSGRGDNALYRMEVLN
jgi:hypothetical protein